ncbi:UNVERIFIED_CONTAM: hypothetical protein K2H54_055855 [Gekko kuhli]
MVPVLLLATCCAHALLCCPGHSGANKEKYGCYCHKAKLGSTVPLVLLAGLGAMGLVSNSMSLQLRGSYDAV